MQVDVTTVMVAVSNRHMVDAATEAELYAECLQMSIMVTGGAAASWWLWNKHHLSLSAWAGRRPASPTLNEDSHLVEAALTERAVFRAGSASPWAADSAETPKIQGSLAVPVRMANNLVGVLSIGYASQQTPLPVDIDGLESLGVTAVMLLTKIQESAHQVSRISELSARDAEWEKKSSAHATLVSALLNGTPIRAAVALAARALGRELIVETSESNGSSGDATVSAIIPGTALHLRTDASGIDGDFLSTMASTIALSETANRDQSSLEARLTDRLIERMIEGSAEDSELAYELALLGLRPDAPYRVLALGGSEPLDRQGVNQINSLIAQLSAHAVVASSSGAVIVLWPDDAGHVREAADRIMSDASSRKRKLAMGISDVVNQLDEFPAAAREALFAQRHAAQRNEGSARIVESSQLGFLRVLAQSRQSSHVGRVIDDTLGPLNSPEFKGSAELRATLRVYLEQDRRPTETARRLHIHVNTLRYRLRRIAEVLPDLDLEDVDTRFSLLLALKLLDSTQPNPG